MKTKRGSWLVIASFALLIGAGALFVALGGSPRDRDKGEAGSGERHGEERGSSGAGEAEPATPLQPNEIAIDEQPSASPQVRSEDRARIRQRLLEKGSSDPSSWPSLPGDYIREQMIRDLSPLVDECACEIHRAEAPIAIVLDMTLISAPEIGGIIDTVEPHEGNEASGPLLDCITESANSVSLPPAPTRGTTTVTLHANTEQCEKRDTAASEDTAGEGGS